MFHLGGANAESETGEGAVGRGVRVAAHHRHTRKGRPLLRADDMHNALARIVHLELGDAVPIAVLVERVDLEPGDRILDAPAAVRGGYVVIGNCQIGIQPPQAPLGKPQALECLG